MNAPTKLFYEFGQFRLDVGKHRLMRDGEIVSLTPKAVETLRVLVERQGLLVERDELMDFVWPDSTVEPGNLDVTISKLRNVLKEKESGQKFIETVPRLGYKFVADVRQVVEDVPALIVEKQTFGRVVVDEEISLGPRASDSASRLLPSAHRRMPVVVATTAALLLGIAGFAYFSHLKAGRTVARIRNIRSIAVLPFRSLSANEADGNFLGSGIADALITRLGTLDQISVRPTSAVLRFDNPKQDSLAAAHSLGVDAVLEGSYQHEGDRLRVTVQLVSARDGAQIWSSTFNQQFKDILAVQDQISQDVARSLVSNLSDADQRLLVKRPTASIDAYQEYLKGRYFWNKRTEKDLELSLNYFQKAIELDPNYALAYAGLADSNGLLVWNKGFAIPELIAKAKSASNKALELDDTLAEAHTSLAFIKVWYDWDWHGAEAEYKRAIELNPNYSTAHHWYGEFLVLMGRFDDGFRELKIAQEEDPLSLIINADIGKMHFFARQPDLAIEQLKKTIEMERTFPLSHLFLAMAYRQKGMYEEAIKTIEVEAKLPGARRLFSSVLGYFYAVAGRKAEARAILQQLNSSSGAEFEIALIHIGLGDTDQAFEWLDKAYNKRDQYLLYLKVDPNMDTLRSDPRFANLMNKIGLSQ
jgi:DNA-binding winged helix-turn-helix (wHTH) protein/TolB-like protein/Tfp pilus assembly protein PilF